MFGASPPEIISGQIYSGPGAGPFIAAASAWQTISYEWETFANSYNAILGQLVQVWQGPSFLAMTGAALPFLAWSQTMTAHTATVASSATAAAEAFFAVFSAVVPPPVIAANRALLAELVATNFLGINTPAIMATEAQYAEMWAQDVTAMLTYQASSAAATAGLTVPPPAPRTANPLSPPALTTAAGNVQGILGSNIFAPGSNTETTGLAGLLNLFSGSSQSAFGSLLNSSVVDNFISSGFYMPSNSTFPLIALLQAAQGNSLSQTGNDLASQGSAQAHADAMNPPDVNPPDEPIAAAQTASRIGGMSVPPSWTSPEVNLVARALPEGAVAAEQAVGLPVLPAVPLAGNGGKGSWLRRGTNPDSMAYGRPTGKILPIL